MAEATSFQLLPPWKIWSTSFSTYLTLYSFESQYWDSSSSRSFAKLHRFWRLGDHMLQAKCPRHSLQFRFYRTAYSWNSTSVHEFSKETLSSAAHKDHILWLAFLEIHMLERESLLGISSCLATWTAVWVACLWKLHSEPACAWLSLNKSELE